jgi:hypothetical protein
MAKPGFIIKCPDGVIHNTTIVYRDENGVETPLHAVYSLKISMEPCDKVMATMELEVIELEMEIAADCTHVKAHPDFRPSVRQAELSPMWVPIDMNEASQALAQMSRNPIKDDRSGLCRCEACRVSQSPLSAIECADASHEDDIRVYAKDYRVYGSIESYFPGFTVTEDPTDRSARPHKEIVFVDGVTGKPDDYNGKPRQ